MAIVPIKGLLLRPQIVAVSPTYRVEGGGVAGVPEVDADGLVRAVPCGRDLPRDWGMVVGGIAVETTVPASFEADVGVIHGLQVQLINWSRPPDVGTVVVDDLGDGIVGINIEYVPLF